MVLSPAPFPCALLAPAGASSARLSSEWKPAAGRPLQTAACLRPSEPLPRETASFLLFGGSWGSRLSAQSRAQARLLARSRARAWRSARRRAQARPMRILACAPPAPGPGLQRRGRQALRIPAINHKAFGNSIIVYPNPFGQCTVIGRNGVLGWCLAFSQAPKDLPAGLLSAPRVLAAGSWGPGGPLAQFRPRLLSGL